jgi:hypothetical protein
VLRNAQHNSIDIIDYIGVVLFINALRNTVKLSYCLKGQ